MWWIASLLDPLILLWGSLGTLLWRERCRAYGVHVSPEHFARVGLAASRCCSLPRSVH